MYITCSSLGKNGNFGNQLFQYAAVVGLAKKHNLTPILPKCQISDCFIIPEHLNLSDSLYHEKISTFKKVGFIKESIYNFDPSIDLAIQNALFYTYDCVDILGYFQTSKYFNYKELNLRFNDKIACGNRFLIDHGAISDIENLIGIHVRRGDYTQLSDYHPPLNIEYYKQAILSISNEESIFLVVSDDVEWCKTNLIPLAPKAKWLFPNLDKFNDFYCLTFCSKIILANSTFSWWAAYLGKNMFNDSNMVITAPFEWFGPKLKNNTKDLYGKGWIII